MARRRDLTPPEVVGPDGLRDIAARLGAEISRDRPDGVVLIGVLKGAAVFLADLARRARCPVGAQEFETLFGNPGGDWLVMTFASANQRGAQIEMFRAARLWGGEYSTEQRFQLAERQRLHRLVRIRMMLHTEARV